MGWSVLNRVPAEGWKAFLDANYASAETKVLQSAIVKGVYYAAVKCASGSVVAIVTLIEGGGWKTMDESMGPYYYDCPASVLSLLTPTKYESALKWRAKCGMVDIAQQLELC
jgi:hypothetical protein